MSHGQICEKHTDCVGHQLANVAMRAVRIVGCAAGLVWMASVAVAADQVDEKTVCEVVSRAKQAKDQVTVYRAEQIAHIVLSDLDSRHTDKGEFGLIAKLGDQDVERMIRIAMLDCDGHPHRLFAESVAQTYQAVREFATMSGPPE